MIKLSRANHTIYRMYPGDEKTGLTVPAHRAANASTLATGMHTARETVRIKYVDQQKDTLRNGSTRTSDHRCWLLLVLIRISLGLVAAV